MRYALLGGVAARETATPPRYNKEGEGGGVIAVIIITKYIIKQTVRGGGGQQGGAGWISTHPPTRRRPLKDTRKGLKTVPFQCQGRWGGVNERLGEGMGGG